MSDDEIVKLFINGKDPVFIINSIASGYISTEKPVLGQLGSAEKKAHDRFCAILREALNTRSPVWIPVSTPPEKDGWYLVRLNKRGVTDFSETYDELFAYTERRGFVRSMGIDLNTDQAYWLDGIPDLPIPSIQEQS